MMYKLSSVIEYDNQSWKVERRFIPCQDRQYANIPLIDHITVAQDYDTSQVYTLIGCHADDYGCLPCESQLDKVVGCLYCPMLLVCHPGIVSVNYSPIWHNLSFCGSWTGETIVFDLDNVLYICSEVLSQ